MFREILWLCFDIEYWIVIAINFVKLKSAAILRSVASFHLIGINCIGSSEMSESLCFLGGFEWLYIWGNYWCGGYVWSFPFETDKL